MSWSQSPGPRFLRPGNAQQRETQQHRQGRDAPLGPRAGQAASSGEAPVRARAERPGRRQRNSRLSAGLLWARNTRADPATPGPSPPGVPAPYPLPRPGRHASALDLNSVRRSRRGLTLAGLKRSLLGRLARCILGAVVRASGRRSVCACALPPASGTAHARSPRIPGRGFLTDVLCVPTGVASGRLGVAGDTILMSVLHL